MSPGPDKARICVGAISGAHGVRGEVRIKTFTEVPEDIGSFGALETEDGVRSFELKVTREVKGGVAARLSGITGREAALALKGLRLYAPRSALPELAQASDTARGTEETEGTKEEEYYQTDLIGLTVKWADGLRPEGYIKAVHDFGAGDLLEIGLHRGAADRKRQTVMVPFTREAVPEVNLAEGYVVADPPEGLMPEDKGAKKKER